MSDDENFLLGLLLVVGGTAVSIGVGYLFGAGVGWLMFGSGCLGLLLLGKRNGFSS